MYVYNLWVRGEDGAGATAGSMSGLVKHEWGVLGTEPLQQQPHTVLWGEGQEALTVR